MYGNESRETMHTEVEEFLDLVDHQDRVIGKLERAQVYAQGFHNFRVINAFLINEQGQLWVPRRTAHKRLFPLHLDVSVGGHVSSGETYEEAFAREMQEEIGIALSDVCYKDLGLLTPHQHGVSAFMHVYTFFYEQVPPYNTNDISEYYWFYPHELMKKITSASDKAKGDIPFLLNYFFENR